MPSGRFIQRFSDYRALLPYSLLGILAGLAGGGFILVFDYLIQVFGTLWLADGSPDDFERLSSWQRFALPVLGALALGLAFHCLPESSREVGIVHVLSRMHSHYGHLPLSNALVQLLGGAVALATGQSGGREGPGVHLGAAINSNIAARLQLPNNSQRILIACGTAGSIAVAFNTPLAGIIFAMEVIVAEYTVIGFTPVILAAVSATYLARLLGGGAAIFSIPAVQLGSLWELPLIAILGVLAGAVAAAFIYLMKRCLPLGRYSVILRFTAAGAITGSLALLVPEVLGMGYDTLRDVLAGTVAPTLLLAIIACKLVATACTVGLGLPVGLIGPNLVIGGCLGGALWFIGHHILPGDVSALALYVAIGMGSAMAAVLNAPLAALLAVVELTQNVHVMFPSMLAIVAATMTTTLVFRQRAAHQAVLHFLRREIPDDPVSQLLHQTNVLPVMHRDVQVLEHTVTTGPDGIDPASLAAWCLVQRNGEPLFLVRGAELGETLTSTADVEPVDITALDLRRWSVGTVKPTATLREAMDIMQRDTVEAIIVRNRAPRSEEAVRGVITRDIIEQYYLRRF